MDGMVGCRIALCSVLLGSFDGWRAMNEVHIPLNTLFIGLGLLSSCDGVN